MGEQYIKIKSRTNHKIKSYVGESSMTYEEKKEVFKEVLKDKTDDEWRTGWGREFHIVGAWKEKDLLPNDFVLKLGIR